MQFWGLGDDCDSTDMDLIEWNGGCQEASEATVIGLCPLPLAEFLAGWF